MKREYVLITYASNDGSSGDVLVESEDAEKLFHLLRQVATETGKLWSLDQLQFNFATPEDSARQAM